MFSFIRKHLLPCRDLALAVIFVEYDRGRSGGSNSVYQTLQSYLAKITGCAITYLRVDNKNELLPLKRIAAHEYTIGGDNRFHEFSGWQKGFDTVLSLPPKPALILFVNDMFLAPGESFLKDYATTELLKKSLTKNSVIGRIDSTGQLYSAYDYEISEWICTNCFLVPRKAVEAIGSLISVGENINDFISTTCPPGITGENRPTGNSVFRTDAPINEAYKNWMVEWLTERWHSKIELGPETWNLFRTKVRNILNEALLTARFTEAGYLPEKYGKKIYY